MIWIGSNSTKRSLPNRSLIKDIDSEPGQGQSAGRRDCARPSARSYGRRACRDAHQRSVARRKQKYGIVTMCIGTGMGAAGIFEALVICASFRGT